MNLFGTVQETRPGWVVIGSDFKKEGNYNFEEHQSYFRGEIDIESNRGGMLLGTTEDIERLRPKSPPKNN